MSAFVFLYYFDINIQKAEAGSLVLTFPIFAHSALGLIFLVTVWPSFPFPNPGQRPLGAVIKPCWDVGAQEGGSSVSHSAKVYTELSNPYYLVFSFSTLIC